MYINFVSMYNKIRNIIITFTIQKKWASVIYFILSNVELNAKIVSSTWNNSVFGHIYVILMFLSISMRWLTFNFLT